MIEATTPANDLPLELFARVVWQESRFQSDAMGPMTRNGQRAQGIAQFMPGTASERRLLDPFDPVQALPKSAEFLNQLRSRFGNLGLAAAAYNAGPRRVQEWSRARLDAAGDAPLRLKHYRCHGRGVADGRAGRPDIRPCGRAHDLPGSDGAAQARAELFCQPARAERAARRRPAMGRPTGRRSGDALFVSCTRSSRACSSGQLDTPWLGSAELHALLEPADEIVRRALEQRHQILAGRVRGRTVGYPAAPGRPSATPRPWHR